MPVEGTIRKHSFTTGSNVDLVGELRQSIACPPNRGSDLTPH